MVYMILCKKCGMSFSTKDRDIAKIGLCEEHRSYE